MKFKSLFSGIIFAVGMSVVIGTCINNTKADTYGDWGYEKNWQGYTISTYTGNDTEVTIPFDLGGISNEYVRIKTGSDESNENLKKVKKVTFGSGYTHINGYAIAGFENVEEVVIPEGVTELEAYAFRKLTNLKKVQFPSTLKKIGENAFRECSSLESVTLKDGLETIKWGVFEDCKGLKSVTVPDSAEMEYDVFRNCLGLKDENGMVIVNVHLYHMDIPSGVTEITIPDGIKVLDGELFYYNNKIKKVIIPEGVTIIQHRVFMDCSNLEEVVLPSTIKHIEIYAFAYCPSLTKINIPEGIEYGTNPFRGCKGLQDEKGFIIIDGTLCDYFGEEKDISIPDGVKKIDETALFNKDITSVKIPDSVETIGSHAFTRCSDLKKVEMSDGVTKLGSSAFEECSSLSEVKLSKNLKVIESSTFNGTSNLKEITIPEGVEEISYDVFKDSGIETITLPSSIKKINYPGLTENTKINYNGTSEQWAKVDFSDDSVNKDTVKINFTVTPVPTVVNTNTPTPTATATPTATPVPEVSVTSQPTPTVTTTTAVTETPTPEPVISATPAVTVPATVTPASDTFTYKGNTYKIKGKTVTLTKGAKKAKVSIPATVKYLGKKYKVTAIGASAFKSNKKLKSVTIGKNVKVIGKKAFCKDSKLSSVTIKSKLLKASKVGKNAFKGVSKSVVFKVPAAKKKAYSKIIAKSLKKYKIK